MAPTKQAKFRVRKGFTLLEMLVASLLLGMLVTILTMVFNSSSIAWRTGKAGVAGLSKIRRQLSLAQYRADNLLPDIDEKSQGVVGMVGSAWDPNGTPHTRAVAKLPGDNGFNATFGSSFNSAKRSPGGPASVKVDGGSFDLDKANSYTVGVLSYGPDGIRDTDDDITTWPLEVE